ncbi:WGR domain-containing protein [Roseibium sediminicola]|uniref:WGR domain-containing protein n=1 Tax=Roseibium sediminicola TaxID=2933272 RepID=A0ABT0H336_9HYPH|nr:WGR domain-containing protein [Roseibium sp. CAU 1639]MCK7616094.1 WGR domain-containing protein [Roseibium sp. CAU 1639]
MQQLEMFPEDIRIERVDPEANMYRFYRLRLMPDLFGGVSLLREWGRIGTQGRYRIELFEDAVRATDAMAALYTAKQKRGYQLAG